MPLKDFLHRCPFCGRQPLSGEGARAGCPGCGRSFEPGEGRRTIRVTPPGGGPEEHPAGALADRIAALAVGPGGAGAAGGPEPGEGVPGEGAAASVLEARASMRRARLEIPIRTWQGRLLGFAERFSRRVPGRLALVGTRLTFTEDGGGSHVWSLEEVRALQGSSSEIQFSPASGGVVGFRFAGDSPRRWEEALKERLREHWAATGLGEIVEFQPRLRGR